MNAIEQLKSRVWGIILAAGSSKRMGSPKLLLPYQNKPILRHVLDNSRKSALMGRTIVVNPYIPGLMEAASLPDIETVFLNFNTSEGLSSSIKAGLSTVPKEAEGALFLLADQPLLTCCDINRVIGHFYRDKTRPLIVQASYHNQKGHPVLFHRSLFLEFNSLTGERGGKVILQNYKNQVVFADMGKSIEPDIDTVSDYEDLAIYDKDDERFVCVCKRYPYL
ncbi:nucleotidyltransferase family protein [Peribacillus sp. B-H-3]|uniref:nucleotidyltransferase family protein n=1 Tax=Peribacillus sp. B-H-3 TaxID=3400420 RepID=UPI003B02BC07